jgi:hypothetical protein
MHGFANARRGWNRDVLAGGKFSAMKIAGTGIEPVASEAWRIHSTR